ncbi:hypothetical protein M569_08658, partial [Genlisea aurea]
LKIGEKRAADSFVDMASALPGNGCAICASSSKGRLPLNNLRPKKRQPATNWFLVRASTDVADDCNDEECAPDKEVGKVSVEWLAGDKTKITGTFPPRNRSWGLVEKDTAGQTNIYSVEPAVYVAESAISSGTAGSSSDGSENTLAITGGLALIAVAAASSILLQVGKTPPAGIRTMDYSGPSLGYYITKFRPTEVVEASAPESPTLVAAQPETSPPETAAESEILAAGEEDASTASSLISS